jgi:hypothetical protein
VKVRGGKAEATLAQADGQLQSLVMEPSKDFQDGGNAGFESAKTVFSINNLRWMTHK